jgi:NADPH2:quinone reductase
MTSQTSLVVTEIGKPLEVSTTRPIPQPGPTQLQIRVTVAALNPHDQKGRDKGLFIKDNLPAVLGNDLAGVVTKLGSDVTKFKVGDLIFAQGAMTPDSEQKGLQQYAVVDSNFSSKVPEGFNDYDAATLPTNLIPSVVALFADIGFGLPAPWTEEAKTFDYSSLTLLIIGGGSNCGRFATQVAKLAGFGRIVVVGGDKEQLTKFGATHILDRHGGEEVVLERIRAVVGDDLVYAFDTINPAPTQTLGVNALSSTKTGKFARLIFSYGLPGEGGGPLNKSNFERKDIFGSSQLKSEVARPFWDRLAGYVKDGSIVPLSYAVVEGLDVEKANEVLDGYRDGKKVVQTHFRIST